jgi:hypothetical protein
MDQSMLVTKSTHIFADVGSLVGHVDNVEKFIPQIPVAQVVAAATIVNNLLFPLGR